MDILLACENWTGVSDGFYKAVGVSQTRMASIIGRANKFRRKGAFPSQEFKEFKVLE